MCFFLRGKTPPPQHDIYTSGSGLLMVPINVSHLFVMSEDKEALDAAQEDYCVITYVAVLGMCLWQVEQSHTAIVSAVCSMTFLQQFDWGLMTDSSTGTQPVQCIKFAAAQFTTDSLSGILSMSINELVGHLSNKLPTTKIRVFRVPFRRRMAPVCQ